LTILGCLYPQRCIRTKFARIHVIALVGIGTIDTVEINFTFVDRYYVRPAFIVPRRRKLHIYFSEFIDGSVLHLNPTEFTIFVSRQIERTMFGLGDENREPSLE